MVIPRRPTAPKATLTIKKILIFINRALELVVLAIKSVAADTVAQKVEPLTAIGKKPTAPTGMSTMKSIHM